MVARTSIDAWFRSAFSSNAIIEIHAVTRAVSRVHLKHARKQDSSQNWKDLLCNTGSGISLPFLLAGQICLFLLLKVSSSYTYNSAFISLQPQTSNPSPSCTYSTLCPGSRDLQHCKRKLHMLWHPYKQAGSTQPRTCGSLSSQLPFYPPVLSGNTYWTTLQADEKHRWYIVN